MARRQELRSLRFESRSASSVPINMTRVNNRIFYQGQVSNGVELFATDVPRPGRAKSEILRQAATLTARRFNLTNLNGTLVFPARGPSGSELWRSDGTFSGTTDLKGNSADRWFVSVRTSQCSWCGSTFRQPTTMVLNFGRAMARLQVPSSSGISLRVRQVPRPPVFTPVGTTVFLSSQRWHQW